ncbi:Gfo/Idh/MocA family protein [Dinghuibacter silviterrae]|uniref:Putative dehydrogenase n=1 Tax=Dinghuibacter silviterrae TaxID=1539049 RepID=A0A4R8DSW6_9BACT|nr:Gfo/Idh/MocA family oxidoreductase [Dinghuibacter silviterrae]TDX01372.1 putative dehydrogenase [Dinghuibacter silviterrae]
MNEHIQNPRPVFVIGAGGIVQDAHLPAYRLADFPVLGIYDAIREKAAAVAEVFGIPQVFGSLREMVVSAPERAVFDIALPADAILPTLEQLPEGSAVLIQKPLGRDMAEAKAIARLVKERSFVAGVNVQLRYAPFIAEARRILAEGRIGPLCDIDIHVHVYTPWHLWTFLQTSPRIEILYHSIHYIDLVRNLAGDPKSVYAKTVRHPSTPDLAPVRTHLIMDYGDFLRVGISTHHAHDFHTRHQQAYIQLEGTQGAIRIGLGLLLDYPKGQEDTFEYIVRGDAAWQSLPLSGSWFPHAFIGSMAQVMAAADGLIPRPDNSVDDVLHTMACVEAAYRSSEEGGVRPELFL